MCLATRLSAKFEAESDKVEPADRGGDRNVQGGWSLGKLGTGCLTNCWMDDIAMEKLQGAGGRDERRRGDERGVEEERERRRGWEERRCNGKLK
eukprot:767569-Hanusia_phi.AAC.2